MQTSRVVIASCFPNMGRHDNFGIDSLRQIFDLEALRKYHAHLSYFYIYSLE